MSFREMIFEILWSQPKLLAKSNVKHLQWFLIYVYAAKNVWEVFLIVKNLWCISDFSNVPPPEYEIPPGGSDIEMWKKECDLAWKKCEYHLFLSIHDLAMNSYKIFSGYYPEIWSRTGKFSTAMLPRALWFVTIDHVITNVGRFFFDLFVGIIVQARHGQEPNIVLEINLIAKPGEVDHINIFKDMLCALVICDVFGLTGVAWIVMLNQLLDLFFFQKFKLETDSYRQMIDTKLPGTKEIIDLANKMGFFKRDLILELGDDEPPMATHYNFISSDVIVATKTLLEKLPPLQSKSIVGHAMIHWKAGYSYWDHLGRLLFLCAKLYICAIVQGLPSFFKIEEEVHPAIMYSMVYTVVFPDLDDIAHGIAGWVHTWQVFNCDKSIEDAFSSLVYLKKALVQMAIHHGYQRFDGWYSSWFFGEPSLIGRISRIRRRNS